MRSIKAALIHNGTAFAEGLCVVLDGDRIVEVGPRDDREHAEDWGDVAIVPGTVNAHGHSFQNLLKGFADDRRFESWRDEVLYPFSERLDAEAIYAGALFAFTEALLAGVTTIVDFFYLHDAGNENARVVARAAHDAGIRLVLARALYDPDAPTRAPARYREPVDESIARLRDLAAGYAGDPLVHVQPAPHSLHAAAPATIAAALEAARDEDVPCHLHLAEARYEVDQIVERYGTTPVRLLQREGLLDPHLLTVHTVWIDEDEMDMLASAGVGVVHCPGANAFLGDGIAQIPEMLHRGIPVALGPDGGCANNRQSVFDEMRMAGLVAKARLTDGGALDARETFRLGTAAGGELLRLDVGSLRRGMYADLVALDLNDASLWPLDTLERQVVNSMQPTAIAKVMVGGSVVAERGRLMGIDHSELRDRIHRVTQGWTRP